MMRIVLIAVTLLGSLEFILAQSPTIICPSSPQVVSSIPDISIPRPNVQNFPANAPISYIYLDTADFSLLVFISDPSETTHVVPIPSPVTVTRIRVIAQGGGQTANCEFDVQSGTTSPCSPNPCENGGQCAVSGSTFSCTCTGSWTGQTCTTSTNPCSPSPCQNGGVCTLSGGTFQCTCTTGFTGNTCQTSTNPCSPSPCQNSGVCTLSGGTFQCTCPTGFTGNTCQTSTNPCSPSPCQNGGVCTLSGGTFQCTCTTGFTGNTCQTSSSSNSCSPNPCQNGGICSSVSSVTFRCACPADFVGLTCDTPAGSTTACSPNPCLNGGVCSITETGFTCNCDGTNGFSGNVCNYSPAELCAPGSEGAQACGSRICLNRNVAGQPSYVCECTDAFQMGFDCTVNSDNRVLVNCYGAACKRRLNQLGEEFNYYESPGYPNLYEDRLRALYLLYLPGVAEICFSFDQQAFGIENDKDELYVGAGLQFDFANLQGVNTPSEIEFFENRLVPTGRNTPEDFCIASDTVWMYFLTDKNIMMPGWRLYWTITDSIPPQATCPANIFENIPLGQQGRTITWVEPQAFDDSGITPVLVSRSHTPGSFFPSGQLITVSYLWRDGAENEGGCDFTVFINEVDEVPPIITGGPSTGDPSITVTTACNTGGTSVTWTEPTATDNSGSATLASRTHTPGQFFSTGSTTVTYRFVDPSGNSDTLSFDVLVTEVDNAPPVCTPSPPNDITQTIPLGMPPGTGSSSVPFTEPTAVDDCGAVTLLSRSHQPGATFNTGSTVVSYVFRDNADNTVTCRFTYTVNEVDTTLPVIMGPDDIVVTAPLNSGGRTVTYIEPTATDNSGVVTLTGNSNAPGDFFVTGTTTVTYTFTDLSGNSATYTFRVTVNEVDDELPIITGGPTTGDPSITVTVPCNTGGTLVTWTEPTATDNSGIATLISRTHAPGQFFPTGITTVTYRFVDPSGNSATLSFDVAVVTEVDNTPPVCTPSPPNDITQTIPLGTPPGTGSSSVPFTEPTAFDACGAVTLLSRSHQPGATFNTGSTVVSYEFRDNADNRVTCQFTYTVNEVDTLPPVISGPGDTTEIIEINTGRTIVTWTEPTATDNSGSVFLTERSHDPGSFFETGTTTVTYTFSDPSGNSATHSFNVIVMEVDTTPPVIAGPGTITQTTPLNSGGTIVTWTEPTATDNSGTATLISRSHAPGTFFLTGTTRVTYTYIDPSGNTATDEFDVVVIEVDEELPVITGGPTTGDPSITVTAACNTGGTSVTWTEPTATDNSGIATLTSRTHAPGQFFPTGTTTVTYIFVDPSGNSATLSFDVTVREVDNTPPVCTPSPPNDITQTIPLGTPPGTGSSSVPFTEPTAFDACGAVTLLSRSHQPGATFNTGSTVVSYEFRDNADNRVTCQFTYTVNEVDTLPPVISGPGDTTEIIEINTGRTIVTWTEPTATDNSGSVFLTERSHDPGSFFETGTTTVTYTFSDPSGNSATHSFNVIVMEVDTTPPVIAGPGTITETTPLNNGGTIVTWTEPTATDNSGTATLISRSHAPGTFFLTGTTRVTYTYIDPSGNTATDEFDVVVIEVDGEQPEVTGPDEISVTTPLNSGGRTVTWVEPIATDNSGTATLTGRSHPPGTFFPTGTTTVTYTFTDPSGNTATYDFPVTVTEVDTTSPDILGPDDITLTTPLNSGGRSVVWVPPTATDNSGIVTLISQSHTPGQFFPTGTTRVTYIYTDPSGNTATHNFDVTVEEVDMVPPVITGPDDITETTPLNSGGKIITWIEPTATDNSGSTTLTNRSHPPGTFFPTGTTTVTYTFTDPSGNSETFSFDVTVEEVDMTPPVITGPGTITEATPLNSGGTIVTWTEPTATDNSGTATLISRSHAPGTFFPTGTTRVTYTYIDPSGNTATDEFDVVVIEVDGEQPEVTGPDEISVTTPLNSGGRTVTWVEPIATDNSGTATLTGRSHPPGTFFPTGTTTVTYTFTDPSGNTATYDFPVTVTEVDTTSPDILGPDDITLTTPLNSGGRSVVWVPPTATDNSGIVTLISQSHTPGQFFPTGTTRVTYIYTDPSGNTATHNFDVTVEEVDMVPPVITGPGDITETTPLNSGGKIITWIEPTATDNSGSTTLTNRSHPPGTFFQTGTTTVTYTFTDPSGNSETFSFDVTVEEVDMTPPVITGPGTITEATPLNSGGTIVIWTEPTAIDNSGTATLISRSHAPGTFFPTGTTRVTYTYIDPSGNTATDEFDVVVIEVDGEQPEVTGPDEISVTTPLNSGGRTVTWVEPIATDNSGTATLTGRSHPPGTFFPTGTTTVTYTFTDPSGNTATYDFPVTVTEVDAELPMITGPNDSTVTTPLNSGGRIVTWIEPTATDNSGIVTLVSRSHAPGDRFPTGTTTVTYVFRDPSGNIATYTFDVTVVEVDTTSPDILGPDDITVTTPLNSGGRSVVWVPPTATDNSGIVTLISQSHTPGQFFPTGTTRVTYIYTDPSGNTATHNFDVTVEEVDMVPPVITGPDDITETTPLNSGGKIITWIEPTATDNSGSTTLTNRSHPPGTFFPTGTTTVTYTFTDPSGNSETLSFDVTVEEVDMTPPVITGPGTITEATPLNSGGTIVTWTEPTAIDNSGTATLISRSHAPGTFFPTGTTRVTYTYIDPSGNTATDEFDVVVIEVDTAQPDITGPGGSLTFTAICNSGGRTVTWTEPTATDNSGIATLASRSHTPGQFLPTGTTTITYRFIDPSGNSATYSFDVTVEEVDNVPPVCTPPSDIALTIPLGTGGTTVTWTEPTATDDCGPATLISRTNAPGSFFNTGPSRVTYIFSDISGNTVSCGFNIQITEVDTIPPVITGPGSVTETTALNSGGTTVTWVVPTATDNSGMATLTSQSHFPGEFFPTGTTLVTYTFTDPSGNTATFEFPVIVEEVDTVLPVISGPDDITVTTPLNSGGRTVTWDDVIATDNSGSATLASRTHSPGQFFPTGTTTVTYRFVDPSGNIASLDFDVTVIEIDGTPPVPICPADIQLTTVTGLGGMDINWNEPTASDNSGTATLLSRTHTPGSFFPVGETTVTYRFTDPSGNTGSCSFDVIVSETNPCLPQPCLNGGSCVIESPTTYTCLCQDCYSGDVCQDGADACANNACANGAACVPFANSCTQYFCECTDCFSGRFCTERANPCENHQCQNGAQCTPDPADCTAYTCTCPSCFSGQFCQNPFDACTNNRCLNGGQCVQTPNGGCTEYTCSCSGCFTGLQCQDMRDPCAGSCCENGGICRAVAGSCFAYTCECVGCFSGFNCEIAIPNPCNNNPCLNGGQCNVIPGQCFAYSCVCAQGFTGIDCGLVVTINENPCNSFPCQNGGSCLTVDATYYICVCPEAYLGIDCQTQRSVQINLDSCTTNPCINGQCYNSFHSNSIPPNIFQRQYTCVCNEGFTGSNCAIRTNDVPELDICNLGSRPMCRNGGVCFNDYHSYDQDVDYFCQCPVGLIGHNCETIFINPCNSSPCLNGAQCNSFNTYFQCTCPQGFTGDICQIETAADNQQPTIMGCPASQHIFTTSGGAQATWTPPTATDNMDPTPTLLNQPQNPNSFFPLGRTTVAYVFVDDANNAASCTFFISVYSATSDVTPPVITGCPISPVVANIPSGETEGVVQWTEPEATDNSGANPSRVGSHTPGSRFPQGTTRVTYIFTDSSSNSAICAFDVVVNAGPFVDMTAPVINNCPQDIVASVDGNTQFTLIEWALPTATDDSGTATLTFASVQEPRVLFQVGSQPITITYIFTDPSGKTSTCSFLISAQVGVDTTDPSITNCPNNIQVQVAASAANGVATWTEPQAIDDSGVTPTRTQTHNPGSSFPIGVTQVTYTFTDGSGNSATCEFDVTVEVVSTGGDITPPTLTFCPNDIIANVPPGRTFESISWTLPTATDDRGTATLASGSPFGTSTTTQFVSVTQPDGFINVIYTFVDGAGNEATCEFRIGAQVNAPNPCDAVPCLNGGQCSQITNSFECTCPNGFSGNKCQDSTAADTTDPTVTICPSQVLVQVPASATSGVATWTEPQAIDDSGVTPTRTQTHNPGSSFPIGVTRVTYTFTDGSGNSATCAFDVTVEVVSTGGDVTPPTLTFCPNDIVATSPPGNSFISIPWTLPTATDDSGTATLASGSPFGTDATSQFFAVGQSPADFVNIIYTFVDGAGNEATCEFRIGALVNPPNPCNAAPCLNGGQCSQITNSFECTCPNGFTGNKCQDTTSITPQPQVICSPSTIQTSPTGSFTYTPTLANFLDSNVQISYTNVNQQANQNNFFIVALPISPTPHTLTNLPVGMNTVTVTATDTSSETATCTFQYFRTEIQCPTPASSTSTSITFPRPTYSFPDATQVTSIDYVINGQQTSLSTSLADHTLTGFVSGTTTTVTATATDTNGNSVSCTFTYTATATADACSSAPCMNGGQCMTFNNGNSYFCQCVDSFTGNRCQTPPPNPCASDPCPGNQNCFYTATMYICVEVGRKRRDVDGLTSEWPCINGRRDEGEYGTKCICEPGHTGIFCEDQLEIPVDSCLPNPCANNGTCLDLSMQDGGRPGDYACKCKAGWEGADCTEDGKRRSALQPVQKGRFVVDGIVIIAMSLMVIVIVILAVLVCYLTPKPRRKVYMDKAWRANEIPIVQ